MGVSGPSLLIESTNSMIKLTTLEYTHGKGLSMNCTITAYTWSRDEEDLLQIATRTKMRALLFAADKLRISSCRFLLCGQLVRLYTE